MFYISGSGKPDEIYSIEKVGDLTHQTATFMETWETQSKDYGDESEISEMLRRGI